MHPPLAGNGRTSIHHSSVDFAFIFPIGSGRGLSLISAHAAFVVLYGTLTVLTLMTLSTAGTFDNSINQKTEVEHWMPQHNLDRTKNYSLSKSRYPSHFCGDTPRINSTIYDGNDITVMDNANGSVPPTSEASPHFPL